MPEFPRKDFQLHVGWRTIKTAVSAMLVAIVYCLIGRNPAFACIGVIFGMGVDMRDSIQNGGNRLFGTLIGGLLSIGVFWVYLLFYPQGGHTVFLAVLLGAATVILILLCQYFWPGGVQPGGVVLCIVLFSPPHRELCELRAQSHPRHRYRRHRGAAGQLLPPPRPGRGLLGGTQRSVPNGQQGLNVFAPRSGGALFFCPPP